MVLADYHNDELDCAWPSQERLSQDCEMPQRTVRYCLVSLERAGFITVTQKGNQYQPTVYHLNLIATAPSYAPAKDGAAMVAAASEPAMESIVQRQKPASEPAMAVHTNRQELLLEPSLSLEKKKTFIKGFNALKDIPKYKNNPVRDGSLEEWLTTNDITPDVFFRAATSLASHWPPKGKKNPDPWLSVRTYCFNRKKWDIERPPLGGDNGNHSRIEQGANPGVSAFDKYR